MKFVTIAEENLATNGKTVFGEIEDMQRDNGESPARPGSSASKARNRQSMKSMKSLRGMTQLKRVGESTPPPSDDESRPPMPSIPQGKVQDSNDKLTGQVKRMGRRKSFMAAVFGRS